MGFYADGETTLYYYSNNWQVLCEYDDSNNAEKLFVYGNYIDEALLMKADGNSTSYHYDKLGSRTKTVNGGTTNYSSNNLNQYTSVGGTGYSYDNNGNLTDDGLYEYYYDCENRLTDVNENSQAVAEYAYDHKGRRISKTISGTTTKYCYDGDQVIAEYDSNDTLLRKFIYGPGIDEPICLIDVADSNSIYYYHFDGLGSVAALSDRDGNVVERYSYDVFGEPNRTSDVNNPYLFTGRRYDPEAGLYYYRTRYYSSDIGRFLQIDPIGYNDGLNLYTYVANNPVTNVDPYGLMSGISFFRKFVHHRYFGHGKLWTAGASLLRKEPGVKGPTAADLQDFALARCKELPKDGECESSGKVRLDPAAIANDSIWMRLTLNGPHQYKVRGRYNARKYTCGDKCACTVNFDNAYIWKDVGDLNLNHLSDRILLRLELARFVTWYTALTISPMDFPIYIRWWDASTWSWITGEAKRSGWPFE